MYKRVSSFVEEKENVANMMSCPLPMTLPILSSALHSDFSPVHIGVKVSPTIPFDYVDLGANESKLCSQPKVSKIVS
ncbi:uncharacterized protein LOC118738074 isoform X2 [Rhagoletis pomonella]|uniref:uncharacterized protein LOC118738074 isoform X2 n=1 Tax=Rhagoletis pomonella TaxID=28610 RepID=UPI001780FC63|nr:uncharacterized protein LOC118738074 isoform X2 [Rhagoletis pomonella]